MSKITIGYGIGYIQFTKDDVAHDVNVNGINQPYAHTNQEINGPDGYKLISVIIGRDSGYDVIIDANNKLTYVKT